MVLEWLASRVCRPRRFGDRAFPGLDAPQPARRTGLPSGWDWHGSFYQWPVRGSRRGVARIPRRAAELYPDLPHAGVLPGAYGTARRGAGDYPTATVADGICRAGDPAVSQPEASRAVPVGVMFGRLAD